MRLLIFLGFVFISSTTALYPPADYDSIVKSSILVKTKDTHHQNHVTSRNGAHFVLTKLQKPEEPQRALLIPRPVLITSLSDKPATIIETHNRQDTSIPCKDDLKRKWIIVKTKQPNKKPEKEEGPVRYTINIHQTKQPQYYDIPKPKVNQSHSFGYLFNVHQKPVQRLSYRPIVPQFGYGYSSFGKVLPNYAYSKPNYVSNEIIPTFSHQKLVPVQQFGYAYTVPRQPLIAKIVPKPSYEYGGPKQNTTVSFISKENTKLHSENVIRPNIAPYQQFGYSYAVSGQPALPKIVSKPSYEYGVPKQNKTVSFISTENIKPQSEHVIRPNNIPYQQFGYSYAVSGQPALPKIVPKPSYEYGLPKEIKENVFHPNIVPYQQFGYSFAVSGQPALPKLPQPHTVQVSQQNYVPAQQFGYSFGIPPKAVVSKPSYEYGIPQINSGSVKPFVTKPNYEYGVPKETAGVFTSSEAKPQKSGFFYTIQHPSAEQVQNPSTEYGVPKVGASKTFRPIVVAPLDETPFASNQHLPIVGKYQSFTAQH